MPVLKNTIQQIKMIMGKTDLKKVFAPTAIAAVYEKCLNLQHLFVATTAQVTQATLFITISFAFQIVGFIIGTVSPIRKLLIGDTAPLHVIDTSAYFLGYVMFHYRHSYIQLSDKVLMS